MFRKLKKVLFCMIFSRKKKPIQRGETSDFEAKKSSHDSFLPSLFSYGYMPANTDFFQAVNLMRKLGTPRELIETIKKDMSIKPDFKSELVKVEDIFIVRVTTNLGSSFPWAELYEIYLKEYGLIGYVNQDINLNGACNAHVKAYFRKKKCVAQKNDLFISYGYWYAKLKLENNEKPKI